MPTVLLDNANRADVSPASAYWAYPISAGGSSLDVISNAFGGASDGASQNEAYWNRRVYPTNCEAEVDVAAVLTGDQEIDFCIRINKPNTGNEDYYVAIITVNGTSNVRLWVSLNGAFTEVSAGNRATQNFAVGDGVRLRGIGTVFSLWIRSNMVWTKFAEYTDNTVMKGGYAGLSLYRAATRADNFRAGGVGDTPLKPPRLYAAMYA